MQNRKTRKKRQRKVNSWEAGKRSRVGKECKSLPARSKITNLWRLSTWAGEETYKLESISTMSVVALKSQRIFLIGKGIKNSSANHQKRRSVSTMKDRRTRVSYLTPEGSSDSCRLNSLMECLSHFRVKKSTR